MAQTNVKLSGETEKYLSSKIRTIGNINGLKTENKLLLLELAVKIAYDTISNSDEETFINLTSLSKTI